jgi:hypothetical protein
MLQVILEDTAIGQRAAASFGLALSNCSLDPDVIATMLAPYTNLVNNPDPYFQLGRWTGRATALALAVGETVGGGSAVVLSVVGAGPTGGAALLATPAAAKVTAHGALVIGGVIAKERADPLLLRLPALFAAAKGGGSRPPKLKLLHSQSTLDQSKLDYWRGKRTDEIIRSLTTEGRDKLEIRPDGTVLDGNHRVQVLIERGYDTSQLYHKATINPRTDLGP